MSLDAHAHIFQTVGYDGFANWVPTLLTQQGLSVTSYSWSRLSVVFSAFVIAWVLERFGVAGVFALISGSMVVVMLAIGLMGPATAGRSLEDISTSRARRLERRRADDVGAQRVRLGGAEKLV